MIVHVWSEFGRRAYDNGSGTDHGAAGASLLIGTQVTGQMVGEFPGVATLDEYGNLLTTVDYRAVYCSLLEQWFGADPAGDHHERQPVRAADADQVLGFRRRRAPRAAQRPLPRSAAVATRASSAISCSPITSGANSRSASARASVPQRLGLSGLDVAR